MTDTEITTYIEEEISSFFENDSCNTLAGHNHMKIYDTPLIGYALADDPCFKEFSKPNIIGPHYTPPNEWLTGAKSVIVYFMPFTKQIRDSNRLPGLPSLEWVSSRKEGESFNNVVRAFLVDLMIRLGGQAAIPLKDSRFFVEGNTTNWSERHAAFAAGLGTFGLHKGIITQKGCAGRVGSVITTLELIPTERSYTQYFDYCLYLARGQCGACIKRCPAGAISKDGKNNQVCSDYIEKKVCSRFASPKACAKCNVGVPCEYRNPSAIVP